jgi:hypothetical protein
MAALQLLARINGMLINKTELSGPGGAPVQIDHTIDHKSRIFERLDAMAKRTQDKQPRLPAPTEAPIMIDVTPNKPEPIEAPRAADPMPAPETSAQELMERMKRLKI